MHECCKHRCVHFLELVEVNPNEDQGGTYHAPSLSWTSYIVSADVQVLAMAMSSNYKFPA